MITRQDFHQLQRIVIKIGSSLLTAGGQGLNQPAIAEWVKQIAQLKHQGKEIILVSSGAVAEGMCRLGLKQRPKTLHELQAAASVGQMGLVRLFEHQFQSHQLHTGQILLTHDDLKHRQRYLNARSTLLTLLNFDVIPIINENDTVATDEIRFGDNDTLAALVANLVEADLLILLTDQLGLFNADPSLDSSATLIQQADVNDPLLDEVAGGSRSGLGRGGMFTKIRAARLAARSGAGTIIVSGMIEQIITRLINGDDLGSYLIPNLIPIAARKQWLAAHLQIQGQLILDAGAIKVLLTQGKSLLAIGVTELKGQFERGDLVSCLNQNGEEIARGLINYSSQECLKIIGKSSQEFETILGYADEEELIHRDNMVLMN
ncbi:MAG: hypothetical protein RL637_1014 [Pseudomonadota bacterium]|jgi:glutamate 5-kinase